MSDNTKYPCSMSTLDKNGCSNTNVDDLMFHYGPSMRFCSYEHASDFYKILEYNRDNGIEFSREEMVWMAELDLEMYKHSQSERAYESFHEAEVQVEAYNEMEQELLEQLALVRQDRLELYESLKERARIEGRWLTVRIPASN